MRRRILCAVGMGIALGLTLPRTAAFADTQTELPAFEAPSGEESQAAGEGGVSPAGPGAGQEAPVSPAGTDEAGQAAQGSAGGTEAVSPAAPDGSAGGTTSASPDGGQAEGSGQAGAQAGEAAGDGQEAAKTEESAEGSQEAAGPGTAEAGPGSGLAEAGNSTISHSGSQETSVDYSQIGPGIGLGSGQKETAVRPEYTTMTVGDPVVQVVEKYSYDQMVTDISALQQRYGTAHMQVNTIGTSADGRAIYDIVIGSPNAENHVLIQGAMHAREYLNPLLMMKQIEEALAFYDTGSYNGRNLSDLLDQVAVHFVPMSNPDGVALSQFGLDAIRSQELKDKIQTCYSSDLAAGRTTLDFNTYLTKWKANARGVDLNSHFDGNWANTSSSWLLPSYSGYKGLVPATEPEAQALVNLINQGYNWKGVINYHSMGRVIYWDIEGNKEKARSQHLGQLLSAATGGYQMLYSGGGGGFKDWLQLKDNPIPSVTVETGRVDCPMPISEFETLWQENRTGWAVLADFALQY